MKYLHSMNRIVCDSLQFMENDENKNIPWIYVIMISFYNVWVYCAQVSGLANILCNMYKYWSKIQLIRFDVLLGDVRQHYISDSFSIFRTWAEIIKLWICLLFHNETSRLLFQPWTMLWHVQTSPNWYHRLVIVYIKTMNNSVTRADVTELISQVSGCLYYNHEQCCDTCRRHQTDITG